ncbi:unnamed protein product [Prorocentrum cordatum]|uniref:UBX domain-containing protein n=1 Tax=Prorocentrum cordatum TaxID=2364126 RepID=A0ABN9S394_9DINO|nr:unnamed protein product [Polarella glacialis]
MANPGPRRGKLAEVVDRTGSAYRAWLRDLAARDPELADGGIRLRPSAGRAVNAPADKRTPAERFLARLPEKVVRGGQVVDVRGAIAERLMPGGSAARVSSEPPAPGGAGAAGAEARGCEVSLLAAGRDPDAPSARLQVKLEGGQRVLLRMEPDATVGALWEALGRWRAEHGVARAGDDGRQWCLRSAFPPRAFADKSQTLREAGLVPSAALFVSAGACDC